MKKLIIIAVIVTLLLALRKKIGASLGIH